MVNLLIVFSHLLLNIHQTFFILVFFLKYNLFFNFKQFIIKYFLIYFISLIKMTYIFNLFKK